MVLALLETTVQMEHPTHLGVLLEPIIPTLESPSVQIVQLDTTALRIQQITPQMFVQ